MAKYSIDTSALLDAWVRHYPIDTFPTFWEKLGALIDDGDAVATELINAELNKKDDGCIQWFNKKSLGKFFKEIDDEIQGAVSKILINPNYQRLVEARKVAYAADPFVIALAQIHNLTVVTGEQASLNPAKPKIPNVCEDLFIPCINILDLMRTEGWQF